jgi:hypothetical protein
MTGTGLRFETGEHGGDYPMSRNASRPTSIGAGKGCAEPSAGIRTTLAVGQRRVDAQTPTHIAAVSTVSKAIRPFEAEGHKHNARISRTDWKLESSGQPIDDQWYGTAGKEPRRDYTVNLSTKL